MSKQMQAGLRQFCWSVILFFITAAAARAAGVPIVVTDHGAYLTNEPIKVAFTNGPANPKDWIGIYPEGIAPSKDATVLLWNYLNGTHTSSTGFSQGVVSFPSGLGSGNYVAYLLENDGYRALAQQKFSVPEGNGPFVRLDKRIYKQGEKITVTFTNGLGNVKDWIGIYAEGVIPSPGSTAYKYVDNTTTGSTAVTNGTVTFDTGLVIPGRWVAYFLENDTYTPYAQEAFTVVVPTGVVTIQPDHDHYLPQQPVKISFDGGPGNTTDWIGVYKPGQRPGPTPSTDWRYVGGTQNAGAGLTSGTITIDNGFFGPQSWLAYFLLNDGYDIAGNTGFEVIDAAAPIVQSEKRVYDVGQTITMNFTNSLGNAKDWIGIYKSGETPGVQDSTIWNYVDGTQAGTTAGIVQGSINFVGGLNSAGDYTAYLLQDDGYTVLSSENFSVRANALLPARLLSMTPADGKTNVLAAADFKATLENRATTVVQNSVVVKLDNAIVPNQIAVDGTKLTVTATAGAVLAQGSQHKYTITFSDSAGNTVSATNTFNIGEVRQITLPAPIFLETFDTTPEGSVPDGWTVSNQSDPTTIPADLHHLGSLAYENFTVVSAARLTGSFLTYFNNALEPAPIAQIAGPSSISYVVNGSFVRDFMRTNVLIGISGYHGGNNQILEALTPVYSLSGRANIYISFHTLLEQNQDSIEGIEVTTDGGTTWTPVVYYLDPPDIILNGSAIDVEQTYNTVRNDIAKFQDGSGGYYGAFLKAPLDAAVAAATQGRLDNSPEDGTRVELLRVAAADNKQTVQFRIFYAGTDSWYFGLDDFGIYSIAPEARITVSREGSAVTLSWPSLAGYVLQSSPTMAAGSWTSVSGVTGTSYNPNPTAPTTFYRLFKP